MGIDPFTFLAQVVNFLILVVLLRHFLYRPVLQTMDAREKFIGEQLEKAQQAQKQVDEQARQAELRATEVDQLRSLRLAEVKAEVESAQQQGLARVRQEVSDMGQRWRESKAREIEAYGAAESQRVGNLLLGIVRTALADLATVSLERQMVEVLLARSESLPRGATQIVSAFSLDSDLQARLLERFPGASFEVNPALLAGVVLRANDHKVGWSLDAYLEGLAQKLSRC